MFSHRVCAIFRITDSFTGVPIANGVFTAKVDGIKTKLLHKEDGYFLLMNSDGGVHEIEFESNIYLNERLSFEVKKNPETYVITLKPGAHYPYGANAKIFEGDARSEYIWIAPVKEGMELKIAETEIKADVDSAAIFVPASMAKHTYPDNFLISDGDISEVVCIEKIEDGKAIFTGPVINPHKRGTKLLHTIKIETNGGRYRAILRNADDIEILET